MKYDAKHYFIVQKHFLKGHLLEYLEITTEYPHSFLNTGEKFLSKVWVKFEYDTTHDEH